MKRDIYQKVTDKIVADLEQGELTWLKPWSAGNLEGKITKPLRHNGMPYNGINILMLWGASVEAGYLSPYWMTYRQAKELGAHVKKGERGNLVVYANTITKTEEQDDGSEEERKIPFMKGYSIFNVEQIEGLSEHYYTKPEPVIDTALRIDHAKKIFLGTPEPISAMAGTLPTTAVAAIMCRCQPLKPSEAPKATMRLWRMSSLTGRSTRAVLIVTLAASVGAMKVMPRKSLSPSLAQPFFALIWN